MTPFQVLVVAATLAEVPRLAEATVDLWVGAPLTLKGRWREFGEDARANIVLWQNFLAENGLKTSTGEDVVIHFVVENVGVEAGHNVDDYEEMAVLTNEVVSGMITNTSTRPAVDILLAPYSSYLTEYVALKADEKGLLTMAHAASSDDLYICDSITKSGCTHRNTRRFNNLFSTLALSSDAFRTLISLTATTQGAKTIGVVWQEGDFTEFSANGAVDEAGKLQMEVLVREPIRRCDDSSDPEDNCRSDLRSVVKQLKAQDPDVIVAPTYPELCVYFVQELKAVNYMPKALAFDSCIGHQPTIAALKEDFDFILGVQQWNEGLTGELFSEDSNTRIGMYDNTEANGPSAKQYSLQFLQLTRHRPSYQAASYMACLHTINMAVTLSDDPKDPKKLHDAITYSWQGSMYGQIAFNRFGTITKQYATTQNNYTKQERLEIVTPLDSASTDLIYPLPKWEERVFEPVFWATAGESGVVAVACLGVVFLLGMGVAVYQMRNATVLKAASPALLLTSVAGCLLVMASTLVWTLHTNSFQCVARPVLISYGFSLLFSPLFFKAFHLSRIVVPMNRLARIVVRRKQTLLFVLLPLALDSIVLAIWFTGSLPHAVVDADLIRPSRSTMSCSSEPVYAWLMVSWKSAYAVLGAILMFRARKVPTFHETQSTSSTIAAVLFCSVFVVPISALSTMPAELQFKLRSIGIVIGVLAVVSLLLGQKFALIHERGPNFCPDDVTTQSGPRKTNLGTMPQHGQQVLQSGAVVKTCHVCGELLFFNSQNFHSGVAMS